jgi:hypothetical protein
MATRATYTIHTKDRTQYSFYIHWDGYPAGAAQYIKAALLHTQNNRGNIADAFLRANSNAELTPSKDAHGDTEFHYFIEEGRDEITVTPLAIKHLDSGRREFIALGEQSIDDFINTSLTQGYKDNLAYIKRTGSKETVDKPELVYKIANRYYTKATAHAAWLEKIESYKDYGTRFPHFSGNCSGAYDAIGKAFVIIDTITQAEIKGV